LKTSDFFSFALKTSSDELQVKHNLTRKA